VTDIFGPPIGIPGQLDFPGIIGVPGPPAPAHNVDRGSKGDLEGPQAVDRSGKEDRGAVPGVIDRGLDVTDIFGPPIGIPGQLDFPGIIGTPEKGDPPAAPPAAPAAPFGPNTADPFGRDNEAPYGREAPAPGPVAPGPQTETPGRGLDLSQLTMEYANPNLGLLGAPGPQTDNIAAGHFGDTGQRPPQRQQQPVFDPFSGQWVDPATGRPMPPPAPSLFSMYTGRGGGPG
jgi:hypothetical protein